MRAWKTRLAAIGTKNHATIGKAWGLVPWSDGLMRRFEADDAFNEAFPRVGIAHEVCRCVFRSFSKFAGPMIVEPVHGRVASTISERSKIVGPSVRSETGLADHAGVRRVMAVRGPADPPESLRVNFDMGNAVQVHELLWGVCCPGVYPTLTLHGSNNPAFFEDGTVEITDRVASGVGYTNQSHRLGHDATLLWHLHFGPNTGSGWTVAQVEAGEIDLYRTKLVESPRYARLAPDMRIQRRNVDDHFPGHRFPDNSGTSPNNLPTFFRYYAFTLSVGSTVASGMLSSAVVEIMQLRPFIVSGAPIQAPYATLYYQHIGLFNPNTDDGALFALTLSKNVSASQYGYAEIWGQFRTRGYFTQGKSWTVGSYVNDGWVSGRRARVTLTEVLAPRYTSLRSRNLPITSVPYVWCPAADRGGPGPAPSFVSCGIEPFDPLRDKPIWCTTAWTWIAERRTARA